MASAALPRPPNCSPEPLLEAASWVFAGAGAAGREGGTGRGHLFDTLVSIHYLVCIFPGADYITACVDKHLELERNGD